MRSREARGTDVLRPSDAVAPLPGPTRAPAWSGRAVPFRLEPVSDPPFDRRLVLASPPAGSWIVLTYRSAPRPRPRRPMVRLRRASGAEQDFVLPGAVQGLGRWLGYVPTDTAEIRLAAEAGEGFVLDRVGLRRNLSLFAECLARRPVRLAPALYNLLRGDERRFRDGLRGACAVTPLSRYPAWKALRAELRGGDPAAGVRIRLILPVSRAQADRAAATVASLRAQTHPAWSLDLAWTDGDPDGSRLAADPRVTSGSWSNDRPLRALLSGADAVGLLHPGDRLSADALAILAAALAQTDAPELVYADEETGDADPRPRLKPDWSPDLALATGYEGAPALYAPALVARLADRPVGRADRLALDLGLEAASRAAPERVVHVPRVLCRTGARAGSAADRTAALERHLRRIGSPARVDAGTDGPDLSWPLPDPPPLVTVVIPSRDRLDLIARATRGVLAETEYPAIELVVVDNGSTDPAVLAFYETLRADPRARVAPHPAPFNFSAMVNAGAGLARGSVLVLLNNDVAVLRPDWLDAMVRQACRPEVGAVGAKLLYADGTLQHAGVVVGLGGRAGHVLRRRPADSPGHLGQMRVAHEVSGVTAACLAVERRKYEAVGGFDAQAFPIDFNDVDFCLRLGAAGYKTVWTPRAVLAHLESVSRGPAVGEARARFEREAARFAARWREVIRHDPYYHPALSLTTFGEDLE